MFPSGGFFRGILCPENLSGDAGICRRPYCHFRHIRRVPSVESVGEAKKAGEQKPSSKPVIESSSLPSYRKHKDRTPANKPIAYVPTPLSLCKKPLPETPPQPEADAPPEAEPVPIQSSYTPTPLSELETRCNSGEGFVDDEGGDGNPILDANSCGGNGGKSSANLLKDADKEQVVTDSLNAEKAQNVDETHLDVESSLQPGLSQDEEGREMEDIIIETHTYGGITVTTRTPRSLCSSVSEGDDDRGEYDPFEADLGESKSDHKTEGSTVLKEFNYDPSHDSGFSQPSSLSGDSTTNLTGDEFGDYNPSVIDHRLCQGSMSEGSSSAYDALVDRHPLYELEDTGFKGYSHTASYSYSDSQGTDFQYKVNDGYPAIGNALEKDGKQPAYSTSDHAISKETLSYKTVGGSAITDGGNASSGSKKSLADESCEDHQMRKKNKPETCGGQNKSKQSKTDITKSKDAKAENKKDVLTVKNKMKPKVSTTKVQSGKSKTISSQNDGKKTTTPSGIKKKVIKKEKGEESVTIKAGGPQKLEQNDDIIQRNNKLKLKANLGNSIEDTARLDSSNEQEKPREISKRKVSSEQLSDFFKKRKELQANKPPVKTIAISKADKNHARAISKSKEKNDKVQESTKVSSISKTGKDRVGIFESVKKSSTKIVPKRPSIKECNVDLFAIANDTSSEDEDDSSFETVSPKASIQRKTLKTNLPSRQLKQSDSLGGINESGQAKRSASPSKQSDPKRLRKSSLTLSRRESTKQVELDLFGDDSDGENDQIMLLDLEGREEAHRSPKKPASHPKRSAKHGDDQTMSTPCVASGKSKLLKKSNFHSQTKKDSPMPPVTKVLPNGRHASSSSSQSKVGSSQSTSAMGKTSNFLPSKNISTKKKTSNVGKHKHSGSGKEGAQELSSMNAGISDKKPATGSGKRSDDGFSRKSLQKRSVEITSSEDEDDYDDLPNGLNSVSEKKPAVSGGTVQVNAVVDQGGPEFSDYDDMKRFLEDSSSEEDTFDECYRIFQEEGGEGTSSGSHRQKRPNKEMDEPKTVSVGKQRVAHSSNPGKSRQKTSSKKPKNMIPSAGQMLHNRYLMLQQRVERAAQEREGCSAEGLVASTPGKRRVAHQGTTNATLSRLTLGPSPSESTIAMTNAKMGKRMAHTPKALTKRPVIPADYGSKVPMNIRQRYLNVFIDELLKTADTEQDAFDKALSEEKVVYQRASSKNIYLNLSVNVLKKLQNATAAILKSPPSTPTLTSPKKVISHEAVLGGKLATKTTYSIYKPLHAADVERFDGPFLYEKLKPFILTEEQLRENGFPRPSDVQGQVAIYKKEQNKAVASSDPNLQVCSRCGSTFLREPDGEYITRDACTYHWGRPWTRRIAGMIESRFSCCSGDMEAKGCCVARLHVTNNKSSNLKGFMKTISKPHRKAAHPGMYAMDCEMCYTTMGLELTRVTVVDDNLKEVYDSLVKPDNEVVDYNTRFSGITEEDLERTKTKLRDVQAVLLNMFSADTILMGHSLESDLLALKLMHDTVVDTSVVFPHRRGPPYKRALKTLMAEFLKRLIQDDVGGHDSTEDARSCMELMIWKVKEVAKVKRKR